jgi:hypothetical protein
MKKCVLVAVNHQDRLFFSNPFYMYVYAVYLSYYVWTCCWIFSFFLSFFLFVYHRQWS